MSEEKITQAVTKKFLSAPAIIKFLLEKDEAIENLVLCKPHDVALFSSDQEIYEALATLNNVRQFSLPRLVKFFESVAIMSSEYEKNQERTVLTPEKLTHLLVQSGLKQAEQTTQINENVNKQNSEE